MRVDAISVHPNLDWFTGVENCKKESAMLNSALLVDSWTAIRCVWWRLACVLRSCPLEKCLLPAVAWFCYVVDVLVPVCACLSTLARCAFQVPILSVTSGPS